jgi:pimeloyl-ACP methyl ester carboxylesterase
MPRGTKRAVLRLYRSTDRKDIEALAGPLRDRDPDTLVVWGDRDVYIRVAQAERQRNVFPHARVEILPGVGHWAWLEQPDQVAELVVPFLRSRVGNTSAAQ